MRSVDVAGLVVCTALVLAGLWLRARAARIDRARAASGRARRSGLDLMRRRVVGAGFVVAGVLGLLAMAVARASS